MAKKKQTFRIIDARQSRKKSTVERIVVIGGCFAVLFGPGLLADSAAMQWAGFAILIALILLTALVLNSDDLTIEEAREKLDKISKE